MTYTTKMKRALDIIEEHNKAAQEDQRINFDAFESKLKRLGASSEESLAQATWEDLMECGLPRLLAKRIAAEFRKSSEGEVDHVSAKKAGRMTFKELFEAYNPDPVVGSPEVTERLMRLSKGKRCVVFVDGKVDADRSVEMLTDLCRGLPEVEITAGPKGPARIYQVGEELRKELPQNPIYPQRPLRSGDVCDQTLRSWSGIPLGVRQLVFLAITSTKELVVNSLADAHNILDLCIAAGTPAKMWERVPAAAIRLESMTLSGKAPTLTIEVSPSTSKHNNHPFYQP